MIIYILMYLFIATHLGSGASFLTDGLARHPRCARSVYSSYDHADDLLRMKEGKSAIIHFDKLVYNFQFSCPSLIRQCKFIYIVRDPSPVLPYLVTRGYSARSAYLYYTYRLRRLAEMVIKNPSLVLTFDQLVSDLGVVQNFLGLRNPIESEYIVGEKSDFPIGLLGDAQKRYEYYLNLMLNIP